MSNRAKWFDDARLIGTLWLQGFFADPPPKPTLSPAARFVTLLPYRVARLLTFGRLNVWHVLEKNELHRRGPKADGALIHLDSGEWRRVRWLGRKKVSVPGGWAWADEFKQTCYQPRGFRLGGIPLAPLMAGTTDTFYSSTNDDTVYKSSDNYATAQSATDGTGLVSSTYPSELWVGQRYYGTTYRIYRTALFFDTSSIDDTATVNSANIGLFLYADLTETDSDLTLVAYTGANPPATADYDDFGTTSKGTLNTSSLAAGYNEIALTDLTMISKTGIDKFGVRSSRDISATAPSTSDPGDDEYVKFYSANEAEADERRPYLEVTYAVVVTTTVAAKVAVKTQPTATAAAKVAVYAQPTATATAKVAVYTQPTTTVAAKVALQEAFTAAVAAKVALYTQPTATAAAKLAVYAQPTAAALAKVALYIQSTVSALAKVALKTEGTAGITAKVAVYAQPTATVLAKAAVYTQPTATVRGATALKVTPTASVAAKVALTWLPWTDWDETAKAASAFTETAKGSTDWSETAKGSTTWTRVDPY